MNNIDILEDYIELIEKGYCEDCNELCNIFTAPVYPSKAVAQAISTLIAENKEVKEEIEELKENNGYHLGFIDGGIAKRYEYEDKIKAKIEELDIKIQCCTYADDDVEEYKQDIEKEKARLLRDKKTLQSLLGKE